MIAITLCLLALCAGCVIYEKGEQNGYARGYHDMQSRAIRDVAEISKDYDHILKVGR